MKIHQVKTRLVNTYVVEYPDRIFIIDVAVRTHRYVLGFIEHELKRSVHDVVLVTCTHDDPDHMGGIRRLAVLCNADIAIPRYAGALRSKFLKDPVGPFVRAVTALREGLRGRMWTMYFNPRRSKRARQKPRYEGRPPAPAGTTRIKKRRFRVAHEETLPGFDDWQVIHTPGHSWDSTCFYHPESGSLVTGDTLLGSARQNRVVVPSIYGNTRQMERSLDLLRELTVTAVYPGHGSVIQGEVSF